MLKSVSAEGLVWTTKFCPGQPGQDLSTLLIYSVLSLLETKKHSYVSCLWILVYLFRCKATPLISVIVYYKYKGSFWFNPFYAVMSKGLPDNKLIVDTSSSF